MTNQTYILTQRDTLDPQLRQLAGAIASRGLEICKQEKNENYTAAGIAAGGAVVTAVVSYWNIRKAHAAERAMQEAIEVGMKEISEGLLTRAATNPAIQAMLDSNGITNLMKEAQAASQRLNSLRSLHGTSSPLVREAMQIRNNANAALKQGILNLDDATLRACMGGSFDEVFLKEIADFHSTPPTLASQIKFVAKLDTITTAPESIRTNLKNAQAARITQYETQIKNLLGIRAKGPLSGLTSPASQVGTELLEMAKNGEAITAETIEDVCKKHGVSIPKATPVNTFITGAKRLDEAFLATFDSELVGPRTSMTYSRIKDLDTVVSSQGSKVPSTKFLKPAEKMYITSYKAGWESAKKLGNAAANKRITISGIKGKLISARDVALEIFKSPTARTILLLTAAAGLSGYGVWQMSTAGDATKESVDKMLELASQDVYNKKDTDTVPRYDEETKKNLIAWAKKHADPQTKKMLEDVEAKGYDYGAYLMSTDSSISDNLKPASDSDLMKEWSKAQTNIFNAVANNQFYSWIQSEKKAYEKENPNEEQNEDQKHQDTKQSDDELSTGDFQTTPETPKSEKEVLQQELDKTYERIQKELQEHPELQPILEKYLAGKELTKDEQAKIEPLMSDLANLQRIQKELNNLDNGNKEKSAEKPAQAENTQPTAKGKAVQGVVNPALQQPPRYRH